MAMVIPLRGSDPAEIDVPAVARFDSEAPFPLIAEGVYDFRFHYHETALMFGKQHKVIAWFTVATFGPAFGVWVPRYYNVKHSGKVRRGGSFVPPRHGDLALEYFKLNKAARRGDKPSFASLCDKIVIGRVRTVLKSARQRDLPGQLQYSVIAELIALKSL